MFSDDVDSDLKRLADDPAFPHADAARHAQRYREAGDVADLVAVLDDPHACATTETLFAMAGARRTWLNWVPMPSEALANVVNELGARRARGEEVEVTGLGLSAAEPASAVAATQRIAGPVAIEVAEFPAPDIRIPVRRPEKFAIWRYDGTNPVAVVPAPSPAAVATLHEVAGEPWPSPLAGCLAAGPLGELPLDDLLGLLGHAPDAPATPRWEHLAKSTPTYWFRLAQPWVCLGLLRHAEDEPWATSTRRAVLVDLAFGIEDWVSDAALFALVTAAYRDPAIRAEARELVRARLDAAVAAGRLVTIEESLANLMLITPGCTAEDRAVAAAVIERADEEAPAPPPEKKRRWWQRKG